MANITLSSDMQKTWIFDLDGTLVEHNGYLKYGEDVLLDGVKEFFDTIPEGDMIVILSARSSAYGAQTVEFLRKNGIRYNLIIFDAPKGERILVNDKKPDGLKCAYAINVDRNDFGNVWSELGDKRGESENK